MLEIILTVLKYVGIVIKYVGIAAGGLIGLALILLLLILIIPVRYDVRVVNEENLEAKGKAYWLFHLVSFHVIYENEKMKKMICVCGVPVWKK